MVELVRDQLFIISVGRKKVGQFDIGIIVIVKDLSSNVMQIYLRRLNKTDIVQKGGMGVN